MPRRYLASSHKDSFTALPQSSTQQRSGLEALISLRSVVTIAEANKSQQATRQSETRARTGELLATALAMHASTGTRAAAGMEQAVMAALLQPQQTQAPRLRVSAPPPATTRRTSNRGLVRGRPQHDVQPAVFLPSAPCWGGLPREPVSIDGGHVCVTRGKCLSCLSCLSWFSYLSLLWSRPWLSFLSSRGSRGSCARHNQPPRFVPHTHNAIMVRLYSI